MCEGIPLFSNNHKAVFGVGTNSHSTAAEKLKIDEDKFRKFEYHWWDKKLVADHYDDEAERILTSIDKNKALKNAQKLVKSKLSRQSQIVAWLKKTPDEWKRLLDTKDKKLIRKVNHKLLFYDKKISNFKPSSKTNPYKATKLPKLKDIKKKLPKKVWAQVGDQVWDQVGDQVGAQVWAQVWDQVWDQVGDQVGDQVWAQVWAQVRAQVGDQVRAQVWATSYWAVKLTLGLPIKHWFFDFLKLGIMIVFVKGKAKVFGKKGKYLGEYTEEELFN